MKRILSFNDVTGLLKMALMELEGKDVARIFNKVCRKKIKYLGDDAFEYTGDKEDD